MAGMMVPVLPLIMMGFVVGLRKNVVGVAKVYVLLCERVLRAGREEGATMEAWPACVTTTAGARRRVGVLLMEV